MAPWNRFLCGFLLCASFALSKGQPSPPAGGESSYITYSQGNCSLVFTVPHNGANQPGNIPARTVCPGSYKGCKLADGSCDYSHNQQPNQDCQCGSSTCRVKYLSDSYTKTITYALQQEILDITGKKPHMVVAELQRRKLDANREINEATFGDPIATNAWETFHYYINKVKYEISQTSPEHGLIFDMHGQTHPEAWTEFGYGVPKSKLDSEAYTVSTRETYAIICSLIQRECGDDPLCFRRVLREGQSLGERLSLAVDGDGNSLEYSAIPSIAYPDPGVSSYNYFTGGYNVKEHGSRDCGQTGSKIDAVQIEIPRYIRFDATERAKYAKALAQVIVDYMNEFYPGW